VFFSFFQSLILRLVISVIALIHIVCYLKIYLLETMKIGFVSFRRCFKANVNAIAIVIIFNVIVIDYTVILVIRNPGCGT